MFDEINMIMLLVCEFNVSIFIWFIIYVYIFVLLCLSGILCNIWWFCFYWNSDISLVKLN